jgi:hypothetical protein
MQAFGRPWLAAHSESGFLRKTRFLQAVMTGESNELD